MSAHAHRTALVTGGALRIGRAIVIDLAAHGWTIAIHYNTSGNAAKALAGDIRDEGGQAVAVRADLAREEETAGLLPRAAEEIGPITCLVNNASVFEKDTVETASRLGLAGCVRNRMDGSVEALVQGEADAVAHFITLAQNGPPAAKVARIDATDVPVEALNGFEKSPTA